jgi:glycosyltransferase involved in cell wall biosynthesis
MLLPSRGTIASETPRCTLEASLRSRKDISTHVAENPKMRILMLCTSYPLDLKDSYMTNDLAGALVAAGHQVQVVVTDWNAPFGARSSNIQAEDGVSICVIAPRGITRLGRSLEKATKWVFSSLFALGQMRKVLGDQSFDFLICFTPCVTVAAQLAWATKHFRTRSMLFVLDFFPYHHRSIGLVPGGLVFAVARLFEEYLTRKFDVIGCMSPMNVEYLRRHYRLRNQQQVEVTPIWGRITSPPQIARRTARERYNLPLNKKIAVFGGQMTEGRGVEEILTAAAMLKDKRPDLTFLLIGEGRLEHLVEDRITNGGDNVIFRRRIPRADYLGLISACDLGLVCTVTGVDVPTFPYKTIDYLRANLPIVAAVEKTTDYGRFLHERHLGVALPAGDPRALAEAIEQFIDNPATASAARSCLDEVFDVRRTVARIEDAFGTAGS